MMAESELPCVPSDGSALPVHVVRPAELAGLLDQLSPAQAAFARDSGFTGRSLELVLLPGPDGVAGALFGIGEDRTLHAFGDLAFRLPAAPVWHLLPGDYDRDMAVLGYCLGAYRFRAFKPPRREPARIVSAGVGARAMSIAAATWMVRDLINTPANLLGPAELADAAVSLAARLGGVPYRVEGPVLEQSYPAVAAVGAGSPRAPVVAGFAWRGSTAHDASPLVALCGKGVCFDTGGNDIKPADGMLRMKKDMGGAATVLGMARVIMEADLPVRLLVRIGCVENSTSGAAMRPLDVIRTRRGLTVEVGNTDAEGRLVLADLLAEACESEPAVIVDCATLTGAARVALGPDVVPLFSNDDDWSARVLAAADTMHDPIWRLPLWEGYDNWLDSPTAELNNIGTKPSAGAIIAALFLRRFVTPHIPWIHLDLYAWNDMTRTARPEGGEAQTLRAVCAAIESKLCETVADRNTPVT